VKQLKAAILARRAAKAPRKKRTRPKPRQDTIADRERARDRVAAAERRIDNDRTNNPNWGRAGLERARLEVSVITSPCAVSSSDGSIDLSHLEALPGPSCVSTVPQLKRERSLRARFAEANGNYHNISNTWLVRGFPSSSPLTPATQSISRHRC
jgi:hypothetical protein